jgi:hypothetical protein
LGPLGALAVASAVLVAVAHWQTLRRRARSQQDEPVAWLLHGSVVALGVLLAATAISPVGPQMRYVLVFLHLACLPVAVWLARTWTAAGPRLRLVILIVVLVRVPVSLVLGAGHPMYRPPSDPEVRSLLSGEGLRRLELVPAPFGSGKERELPVTIR